MKKTLLITLLALYLTEADAVTLEECRSAAKDNYPSIRNYGLIEKSEELNLGNASKAWYPGIKAVGFGAGFTDIIETLPIGNSLYGGAVIVNQTVYDGGAVKARKGVLRAESEIENREMDITMHDIEGRVDQLYFGILMLDEQMRQIGLLQENLAIAEKTVRDLMEGGLANQSDLDAVNVSQVQTMQQEAEIRNARRTYAAMLSYFCPSVEELQNPEAVLEIPEEISGETGESRTMALFDSRETLLDAQKKTLNARIVPTVGAFAVGGVHNRLVPAMRKGIFLGGGTVQWNIGAFYTRKNDIALLENQRDRIDVQRETFLFEKKLQTEQSDGKISTLKSQMELDDKAVGLRESILDKSRKKVENGTETVNEMLRNINELSSAKLQKSIHGIQLLTEMYRLENIKEK